MAFSITGLLGQLKLVFKGLSTGKLVAMVFIVGGAVAGFTYLMIWSGKTEFHPLYSNLTPEDAASVVAKLKDDKVPYKLSMDGTAIKVPYENVYEKRLEMAAMGLPRGSGIGFEIFDDTKLGMTEFVQNVNYQRALQGELSRTINGLLEVESSRIHIVMPSQSLFIEEEESATASVILKLRPGKWLSKDQIQGIVHLVSSSVSRLSPEKITIIDNNGKMLAGFKEDTDISQATSDQLVFQEKKERSLENRVRSMLESVLGKDKAIVRISCLLDFVQQEKTEELYLPDNQVVRSEQSLNEASNDPANQPVGVPGLKTNVTRNPATGQTTDTGRNFQKQDKTTNYEIGRMTSRKVMPVGSVQRLSVAVVVDGTFTKTGEGEDGAAQMQYTARTDEEMAKIENVVKSAVDFDAARGDKVEVVNIPFAVAAKPDFKAQKPVSRWMDAIREYQQIFKYAGAAVFIVMTFLMVLRPLTRWMTSTPLEEIEMLQNLPQTIKELESQYAQDGHSLEYSRQAAQVVSENSSDSSDLVKQWVSET